MMALVARQWCVSNLYSCHIGVHTRKHTHTVTLYRRNHEGHKAAVISLLTNFLFFLLALKMLKKNVYSANNQLILV